MVHFAHQKVCSWILMHWISLALNVRLMGENKKSTELVKKKKKEKKSASCKKAAVWVTIKLLNGHQNFKSFKNKWSFFSFSSCFPPCVAFKCIIYCLIFTKFFFLLSKCAFAGLEKADLCFNSWSFPSSELLIWPHEKASPLGSSCLMSS